MEGWLLWAGQACWHGWSAASGHDLRLVAPAELPPERGARPFDLRRCRAGLLHAKVRSPRLGLGLVTRGPAPTGRGFGHQGGRAIRDSRVAVACSPSCPGTAGDAAQRARAGAAAELSRCVAMGGAKELATAAEAAGLPPAG